MKTIGGNKDELDTPGLIIDIDKLDANIAKMQAFVSGHGKGLRPHAKTHRCSALAKKQIEAGAIGVCAAKVGEAEGLLEKEFKGTLITSPVVTPLKIERLMHCVLQDPDMMVVIDNPDNAAALDKAAARHDVRLRTLVGLDPGLGRTGVPFEQGLVLGQVIDGLANLELQGLQCYAGHVQHISDYSQRRKAALECMSKAADVVEEFRAAGLCTDIFTGGGTGSYDIDIEIEGLTDLQAGSYALMDAEYLAIGSQSNPERFEDFRPALSLLTSVISVNQPDWVTLDAGLKAIYHHGAAPEICAPQNIKGIYDWFGDEHGKLILGKDSHRPELSDRIELIVSHCDPTINLHDNICILRESAVIAVWNVDLRGKSD